MRFLVKKTGRSTQTFSRLLMLTYVVTR